MNAVTAHPWTLKMIILSWRNIKMAIQHLKAISESLTNAQLDYYAQKLIYKEEEAKLLLETNFEEELGKSRPTVAEKDAYVTLKLKPIKEEVDKASAIVDDLRRSYEIEKLNVKFTGNFLNTVAGVVDE
jgi:tetrahydromethanopterin S-methyltransferase subunit B